MCSIHKTIRVRLTHLEINTVWVLTGKKTSSALCRCACVSFLRGRKDAAAGSPCPAGPGRCGGSSISPGSRVANSEHQPRGVRPSLPSAGGCGVPCVGRENQKGHLKGGSGGTRNIPGNARLAVPLQKSTRTEYRLRAMGVREQFCRLLGDDVLSNSAVSSTQRVR